VQCAVGDVVTEAGAQLHKQRKAKTPQPHDDVSDFYIVVVVLLNVYVCSVLSAIW